MRSLPTILSLGVSGLLSAQSPGGVPTTYLALWLKADAQTNCTGNGCTVTSWGDAGPSGHTATGNNTPVLVQGAYNHNPTIRFGTGNTYFRLSNGFNDFSAGMTAFVAGSPSATQSWSRFFDLGRGQSNSNVVFCRYSNTAESYVATYNGTSSGGEFYTNSGLLENGAVHIHGALVSSGANNSALSRNGRVLAAGTLAMPNNTTRNSNYIGRSNWSGDTYYRGDMSEVVIFNTALSVADRQKVDSYLCAKYGITLDQSTARSFLASNGTTRMWDHTVVGASTYNRNITLIGRDDGSALSQKQSVSTMTGALVTMGHANTIAVTNGAHATGFTTNLSFLSFGDNGAALEWTRTGAPADRMVLPRTWQVQEYGTVGSVKVQAPSFQSTATTKLPSALAGTMVLLVDADGNMGSGATAIPMTLVGDRWEANVDLTHGQYFTFATAVLAPGGVPEQLALWTKANAGVSVTGTNITGWVDQAGGQVFSVTGAPQRVEAAMNFNPVVRFNGSSRFNGNTELVNETEFYAVGRIVNASGTNASGALIGSTTVLGGDYAFHTEGGVLYSGNQGNYAGTTAFGNNAGPALFQVDLSQTPAASQRLQVNGLAYANNVGGDPEPFTRIPTLGSRLTENILANSELAEAIIYTGSKAGSPRVRIESYLAAKYGITLDQSTARSYMAADNATRMWDHTLTGATTHNRNITVIGRDDASALDQRQSRSVNADALVTVGQAGVIAASNGAHTSTFPANASFLSFGDNGGTLVWSDVGAPTGRQIVPRRWQVQEQGTIGTVKVLAPASISAETVKLTGNTTRPMYLLVDADGDMTSGAVEYPMTLVGTNWELSLDLAHGQYFTFAIRAVSPGGVAFADLALWLRADAGTSCTGDGCSVATWRDDGPNAHVGTGANNPLLQQAAHNFNPALRFGTGNPYFQLTSGFADFTAGLTSFSVGEASAVQNNARYFEFCNGATSNNLFLARNGTTENVRLGCTIGSTQNGLNTATTPLKLATLQLYGGRIASGTGNSSISLNGNSIATGTLTLPNNVSRATNYIARSATAADSYYRGTITEVVVFRSALSVTDQQRVNSYLCAKYGLTLDQSTARSYLASNGTTSMWDHTAALASTYNRNITVIGRDDASDLLQKQSRSTETNNLVSVALGGFAGTNAANANAFTADRSFLSFGDNGGDPAFTTAMTGSSSVDQRMPRVWKVQEVGAVGTVSIALPTLDTAVVLVVSNDAVFDGTDALYTTTTITLAGETHQVAQVDLVNGQFFTFATRQAAPGGVLDELALWLAADHSGVAPGISPARWRDRSPWGKPVNTIGSMPLGTPDAAHNFGPYFSGFSSTAYFKDENSILAPDNVLRAGNITVYAVARLNSATADGRIVGIDNDDLQANDPAFSIRDAAPVFARQSTNAITVGHTEQAQVGRSAVFSTYTSGTTLGLGLDGRYQTATVLTAGGGMRGDILQVGYGNNGVNGALPGDLQEVIWFRTALSTDQRRRVESYLSLKYGITYGGNESTGVAYNYVDSKSDVIWNKTTNAGFNRDIAGVGRDDAAGLQQHQGRSVTGDGGVTIGVGAIAASNAANATVLAQDRAYLLWGHDGGAPNTVFDDPACFNALPVGVEARTQRIWKVQNTGFTQAVTIGFDQASLQAILPVSNLRLLLDDDGSDWTNAVAVTGALLQGGRVDFPGVVIPSGTPYFTLATTLYSVTPLPVELLWFTGREQGPVNLLEWTTASEHDNDRFEVERSSDASVFTRVGQVAGAGNSTSLLQYRFVDSAPPAGTSYYRLRQVDHDGTATNSPMVALGGGRVIAEPCPVRTLDPNGLYTLACSQPVGGPLLVMNAVGQPVLHINDPGEGQAEIDLRHLPSGVYLLRLPGSAGPGAVRLVRP